MPVHASLIITVQGPDKSGKGHAMAAIARALEAMGAAVVVQGAETHNAPKMAKTNEDLAVRLKGQTILLIEQQTS